MASTLVVDAAPSAPGPTDKWSQDDVHKKNLFTNRYGETGDKLSKKWYKKGEVEAGANPENAVFDNAFKEKYRQFLDNHVQQLLKLKGEKGSTPGKSLYDEILESDDHWLDRMLVERLTKTDKGIQEVDEDKIKNFIMTSDGKKVTTLVLEQNVSRMMLAIGVDFAASPEGIKLLFGGNERFKVGVNEQILAKIDKALPGTPAQRRFLAGFSSALGLAGLVGLPGGPAIAGFPAAILGAFRGVNYARQEGLVFDNRDCVGGFEAIAGSKTEKAFAKAVFDIDTDDYVVVPATATTPKHLERRTPHTSMSGITRDKVKERIVIDLLARREFYTRLGVPEEQLDALPEQALLRLSPTSPLEFEKTGADWEVAYLNLFNPNKGGIKDRAGRRRGSLGFNAMDLDTKGNVTRIYDARMQVAARLMQRIIEKEITIEKESVNKVTLTDSKLTRLSSPEGKTARKTEYQKVKTDLEADKTAIESGKGDLESYKTTLLELQTAKSELAAELAKISIKGTPDEVIAGLQDFLNSSGINIAIGGKAIRSLVDREIDIDTRMETEMKGISPFDSSKETVEVYNARTAPAIRRIETKFQQERSKLDQEKQLVEQTVTRLQDVNTEIKGKSEALNETGEAARKMKPVDSGEDFANLTAWGITDIHLKIRKDLIALVNAANVANPAANPAVGWPESQNGRPEHLAKIYRAIVESHARQIEPLINTPGTEFDTITGATWQVSENQLRTLPENEIDDLITQRVAALGVAGLAVPGRPTIDQIRKAMQVAGKRFTGRENGFNETIKFINGKVQEQDELMGDESAIKRDIDFLTATSKLLKKRAEKPDFPTTITKDPSSYVDAGLIAPTDKKYTDEERAANQPKGYYEILDLIYGYKDADTNRGKEFEVISKVITPDRLARHLNAWLVHLPGPAPLATVLTELGNRINGVGGQKVEGPQMQKFIRELADELFEEGRAIPG